MQIRGYETYLDGVPVSSFNAECVERSIAPAAVITYTDWLRQSLNPIYYGVSRQYKVITLKFEFQYNHDEDLLGYSGGLVHALEHCQLKFSNVKYCFNCVLASASLDKEDGPKEYLSVTLNASYAYLPAVETTFSSQLQALNVSGNLPTPAIVTLTPSQDIETVTLSGITKQPIAINNLHAGAPVQINGESGTVTEPDLDTVMTDAMGSGKWLLRKYSMVSVIDPDSTRIYKVPQKSMIPSDTSYIQQLISDAANLYHGRGGYDYLGYLKTAVYISSAKTITIKFLHDDGVNLFVDGASKYTKNCPEDNGESGTTKWPGYPSISVSLTAGWHKIELLWLQHVGDDGIWGLSPTISSQVDYLNAYYARDSNPAGTVNKFPDADMWAWPVLQPGNNTISIDNAQCAVKVSYKPKFM